MENPNQMVYDDKPIVLCLESADEVCIFELCPIYEHCWVGEKMKEEESKKKNG